MSFGRFDPVAHAERRQGERERNLRVLALPNRSLSKGTMTGATSAHALPKGETAKPGKRAPTKEEREWMDAIVAWGCVACHADGNGYVHPQVHHILRGGRRIGHLFTLPLCRDHHQDGGRPGFTARHPWKKRFEALYGAELRLLEQLRIEIARRRT